MRRLPVVALLVVATGVGAQTAEPWPSLETVLLLPGAPVQDPAGDVYVLSASGGVSRVALDGTADLVWAGPPSSGISFGQLATDGPGNVYAAAGSGALSQVVRIAPDGTVTQLLDSKGTAPLDPFHDPSGLAVDAADHVWVTGRTSDNIFRIAPSGQVSLIPSGVDDPFVLADGDEVFIVDGKAVRRALPGGGISPVLTAASLGLPSIDVADVAVAPGGTVVVLFRGEHALRFVAPDGTRTVVPTGVFRPSDIDVDPAGHVWATGRGLPEGDAHLIEVSPGGAITTHHAVPASTGRWFSGVEAGASGVWWWDVPAPGPFAPPEVVLPMSVWHRAASGAITRVIDATGDGAGRVLATDAFWPPHALALTADGAVLASSRVTSAVLRGRPGAAPGLVLGPDSLVPTAQRPSGPARTAAGTLLVCDEAESRLLELDGPRSARVLIGPEGDGAGHVLERPVSAVVAPSGEVYVTGLVSRNVLRLSPDGTITEVLGPDGTGPAQPLLQPAGLAVDPFGNVFVAGSSSHNVFRIAPDGTVDLVMDASGDQQGHALQRPTALAVDGAGALFVVGNESDNVFRVSAAGAIEQVLDATGDGLGHVLDDPRALAVGFDGDLYVGGWESRTLFHRSAGGAVTELLGTAGAGGTSLGLRPEGVAVDPFGTLYVSGPQPQTGRDLVVRLDPGAPAVELHALPSSGLRELLVAPDGDVFVVQRSTSQQLLLPIPPRILRIPQAGWWSDLGGGTPGTRGRPTMHVKGDLTPGTPMARVLTHVPPGTLLAAWVSTNSTPLDVIGGTVHAWPPSHEILFAADAGGQAAYTLPWPAGFAAGLDVVLQFIVLDPGSFHGLTLSNAMVRTTP